MKLKSLLSILVISVSIGFAQVPSYLPSNGLVGWWPFNGNANDESGRGNHGIVHGATLASDRFGNSNAAYNFSTSTATFGNACQWIELPYSNDWNFPSFTLSAWIDANTLFWSGNSIHLSSIMYRGDGGCSATTPEPFRFMVGENGIYNSLANGSSYCTYNANIQTNQWYLLTMTFSSGTLKQYLNGVLINSCSGIPVSQSNTCYKISIGEAWSSNGHWYYFNGKLDDIGIWNRELIQTEITALYNASPCLNDLTISPALNTLQIGNTATFTATTSNPNPNLVWQTDFGQGYQTLNNFGNYSGVNTNTLSISNIQLSAHNQPIRVIANSGNCIDTSNVATISISDTCTTLISVTDTLIINTSITGITPPNNLNTIKVFPNPANDHVTINYGSNFASMNGYSLKITNAIGQVVFATLINQQSSYVDLSTWSGNGIYFLQILDTQNNIIENRKIILQ